MKGWAESDLNNLAECFIDYRGKTPIKTEYGVPLVTAKIVKNGRILEPNEFISVLDYPAWMRRGFPQVDDVVLTTEAPLGEVALLKNEKVALAQRIILIRGKKRKLHNQFLKYYLQSPLGQEELQVRASGTTVSGIKASELKKITVVTPGYDEQQAIAAVLSSLDDKIDLLHRQNVTLEAMAEALFRQWFVVEAKEEWASGTLGDFALCIRDGIDPKENQTNTAYVGLEHIDKKNISLSRYGDAQQVTSTKFIFQNNDILFGKLRPYFHKVCFASFNGVCSTDILVIRAKKEYLFSFCLFAFFQNDVVEYANIGSKGTKMPRTDWETLSLYPFPIPDTQLIIQFDDFCRPLIEKICSNQTQIRTLENLRDTLLPKLMSGEVRVSY